jgi:UDP-N-acetylmuramate--alanine ligase
LLDGFTEFTNKVPFFGFATLCLDHPRVQALLPRIRRRVITYGLATQADCRAEAIEPSGEHTAFTVVWQNETLGRVRLGMPGRHNVENALAAIAVCLELGVAFSDLQSALDDFKGVDRRFSIRHRLGEGDDEVTIIDDYGHHPAEIQATLSGAREAWPHRRIVAVFQPHRYSRVRDLLDDFARSFNLASHVVACPIYRAGEKPIEGYDVTRVAGALRNHGHRSVMPVTDLDAAVEHLAETVRPGDVVITLGAGDVNRVCSGLAHALTDAL